MPAALVTSAAVVSIVVSSEPLVSSSKIVLASSRTTTVSRTASYSIASVSVAPYFNRSYWVAMSSPTGGTPLNVPPGPGSSLNTCDPTPSDAQIQLWLGSYATPSGSVSPNVDVLKLVGLPPAAAWTNSDFLSSSE